MPTERTVLVRLKADVNGFNRGLAEAAAGVGALRKEINTTNDRTAWLTQGILAIAPAVVPLGAAAIPVFTGIATQMTVGAVAAGTLALGFNGIGDALKALNDYQIDPTDEHLKKLHETMANLSSEGRDFVTFLDSLGPIGNRLQNTAQAGMFPGIESGLERLVTLAPQVRRIVAQIASGIGQLADEAGGELAGPKFEDFFNFLEHDARPILIEMGHTLGHFAAGLANLFVAFLPESEKFSTGFERMSESFERWTAGLSKTQGFKDFIDYIDKAGPQALDFIGALSEAIIALLHAAAPVGTVMLPLFTELLQIFTSIAETPIGSTFIAVAAAMSLYGRSVALASNVTGGSFSKGLGMANREALRGSVSFRALSGNIATLSRNMLTAGATAERMAAQNRAAAAGVREWGKSAARVGGQAALLGVAASGVADKVGLTDTATLALAGSLAGPWGAAVGGAVGLVLDFSAGQHRAAVSAQDLTDTLNQQTGSITEATRLMVAQGLEANGTADAARDLGLNLGLVGAAAMGNRDAMAAVNAELAKYEGGTQTIMTANGAQTQQSETAVAAGKLRDALHDQSGEVAKSRQQWADTQALLSRAGNTTDDLTAAQKHLAVQTRAARQAAQASTGQFKALGDDVDNAKVSLNQWIRQMVHAADALRNFGANAEKAADKGLRDGLIKELEDLGPVGALRMKQLANASQVEIGRANHAWTAHTRAVEASNRALTAATSHPWRIDVETAEALSRLRFMQQQIDRLHGKSIMIRAQGGHVPAVTDYWTGGYTGGGGKYEPRGIVHAGEVVLDAATVARDWEHIRHRYGYLPGFYDGGYVGAERGQPAAAPGGSTRVNLTIDEIPVRGKVDIDTGAFVGMARVIARSEIDEYRSFDAKQASR